MQLHIASQTLLLVQPVNGGQLPGQQNDVSEASVAGQGLGYLVSHQLGGDQAAGYQVGSGLM